jgi:hypothetical protein
MKHLVGEYLESIDSQIQIITLRKPLNITIKKSCLGVDVFCPALHLIGSGDSQEHALQMFFDHLFIDYYDLSLNPGVQSPEDEAYGRKLKLFFNSEKKEKAFQNRKNNS